MTTKDASDLVMLHPAIAVAGRVLFTLIFYLSGVTHFTDVEGYVSLMPAAIPFRSFWVVVSAAVELVGATLIVTGRYPRLGAWMIVVFLVPVTITVHGFAMVTAPDVRTQQIQVSFFLKGIAMIGAALLITQFGITPRERSGVLRGM